jgi:hypothetical protein
MLPRDPVAPRGGFWAALRFWAGVAVETFTRRRFSRVLERRLAGRLVLATGGAALPRAGTFVLAVNHYEAGLSLDVVAAVLTAAERERPGVAGACLVVVGQRAPSKPRSFRARVLHWIVGRFFRRWSANVLRIPAAGGPPGLAALRAWRRRLERQPVLVLPEGAAGLELGSMRAGAGRWLGGLSAPTVPVGVWWGDAGWRVAFGAPVDWSSRTDLRDLQLGLAIAALLPPALAPSWQALLGRWRDAHAAADAPPAALLPTAD